MTDDRNWGKIIKQILGQKCAICGATEKLEIDHIRCLQAGGQHEIQNLQVLCSGCHQEKTIYDRQAVALRSKGFNPELIQGSYLP
jgi:5-methylcytosine-specific restriction endonuclease McrA